MPKCANCEKTRKLFLYQAALIIGVPIGAIVLNSLGVYNRDSTVFALFLSIYAYLTLAFSWLWFYIVQALCKAVGLPADKSKNCDSAPQNTIVKRKALSEADAFSEAGGLEK
jgi:hypothetical protein